MSIAKRYAQTVQWKKPLGKATGNGVYYSWLTNTGDPASATLAGTSVAAGVVPVDTDAGYPVIDSFNGELGFIHRIEALAGIVSSGGLQKYMLYDMLWKAGAYPFNASQVLAAQPSYSARVPNTDYKGLEIWIECVTNFTGNGDFTITYTNDQGVAGRSTFLSISAAGLAVSTCFQMPLQTGDQGVQKIESVTCATATVGTFNVLVMRPLVKHLLIATSGPGTIVWEESLTNLPRVYDTSALYVFSLGSATFNTANPELQISIGYGTIGAGTDLHVDLELLPQRKAVTALELLTAPAVSTTSTSAAFTFSASGPVEYSVDGGAYTPSSSPINLAGLSVASHTITIRVIATPTEKQTFTWNVVVQPTLELLSTPAVSTTSTSASFTFSASGAVEASVDGGAYAPATSPINLSSLSVAAHSITIRVVANPSEKQTFSWSVITASGGAGDGVSPVVTILSLPATSDSPLVVSVGDASAYSILELSVRDRPDDRRLIAYNTLDGFVHPYAGKSTVTGTGTLGNPYIFTLYRRGRWPTGLNLDVRVQAIDNGGNGVLA